MKEENKTGNIIKETLHPLFNKKFISMLMGALTGSLTVFLLFYTTQEAAPETIISFFIASIAILGIVISLLIFLDENKPKISSNENNLLAENSNLDQEINKQLSDILNISQIEGVENLKNMIDDIVSQNKILKENIQKQPNIEKQLISNIEESKVNAERLFKRSSYSLIVGGGIAISGVLIFYFLNINTDYNKFTDVLHFLGLIPRFGILFFIEYVAFFFLKQYRVLMEEYRYYEAIKRDRQNLLSLYYLVDKYKDEKDILELINTYFDKHAAEIPRYSGDNRVKMEKSLNEDMDLISKIIKMIQVIKSTDKSKE